MDARFNRLRPRTVEAVTGLRSTVEAQPDPTVSVRIKELTQFPGDQVFSGGAGGAEFYLAIDAAPPLMLLRGLRGFRFVNVAGTVYADVNGGGARTVLDKDTFDFVRVASIKLTLAAGASVTLQQWAE